jgi:transcriptional regulator with XRE-family HTH domain
MTILESISEELARQGLSRYALAKRLGIQSQTIYRWFNGGTEPLAGALDAMMEELGLEVVRKCEGEKR